MGQARWAPAWPPVVFAALLLATAALLLRERLGAWGPGNLLFTPAAQRDPRCRHWAAVDRLGGCVAWDGASGLLAAELLAPEGSRTVPVAILDPQAPEVCGRGRLGAGTSWACLGPCTGRRPQLFACCEALPHSGWIAKLA